MASFPQMAVNHNRRVELLRSAPKNSWVAMSSDESRIITTGKTFLEVDAAAKQAGETDYFITRTPDAWLNRIFLS